MHRRTKNQERRARKGWHSAGYAGVHWADQGPREKRGKEEEEDVAGVLGDTCSSDGWPVDGEETPPSKEHSSRPRSSLLACTIGATTAPESF